jgi:hypothetical protein
MDATTIRITPWKSGTTSTTTSELAFWAAPLRVDRPLADQMVDAFCRLHNAALVLKEAWSCDTSGGAA